MTAITANISTDISVNTMDIEKIKKELSVKGFCIVPGVLTQDEVEKCLGWFRDWQKSIPDHDYQHSKLSPHGIYKFHQAGHQRHAWFIRTRKRVREVFEGLWDTKNLVVSFDGSCYIPKELKKKDKIWTHTDQGPGKKGLQCIQGYVSLTTNKERTFVCYEGTHHIHEKYFADHGMKKGGDWQLIEHSVVDAMQNYKRVNNVPAGSLVLWDSRVFHQNQYGKPGSEERIVQYVCYLPKNHPKNTMAMRTKRAKYFKEIRTTSHWPCPIKVNGLQGRTFGNEKLRINYDALRKPQLDDMMDEIKKLL